jgi:hypothetical protein
MYTMSKVTATELPLLAGTIELGKQMMADQGDEADSEANPLEFYAVAFMENMSESGYSELRPRGRRSVRALANIVRVVPADLKAVKAAIGYKRKSFYQVALGSTIIDALSKWEPGAEAMKLLNPYKPLKPFDGPYYPKLTELRLKHKSNWPFHHTLVGDRSPELKRSMIALAGLFRVNKADLRKIAKQFTDTGTPAEELEACLAEAIIESVRTEQRFACALGAPVA